MKVPSPRLKWHERIYLFEVVRGLGVTLRHLVTNLFHQTEMPTVQWPEETKPLAASLKSRHRLTVREDGSPKCVACFMCQAACPARCINIVAEESPDPTIEKRPKVFEIDLLRCVFCGYCVEACPEDAIRMDTGEILIVSDRRDDFIVNKEFLLYDQRERDPLVRTETEPEGTDDAGLIPPPDTPADEVPIPTSYGSRQNAKIPAEW
jgi:NADH-quinone oxidoreductase subunit I